MSDTRLPGSFVKDGLDLAKGSTIFGFALDKLSKDELIACVAQGWKRADDAAKEGKRRADFLTELRAGQ